jgi:ATP-binding cassette subfamily B protein
LLLGLASLVPLLITASQDETRLVVAIGGILQAHAALAALAVGAGTIASASVAWARIQELFRAAARVGPAGSAELAGAVPPRTCAPSAQAEPPAIVGPPVLDARCVWFRYPGGREAVLSGCDFSVHAGDRVLLQGSSGAGKSTLAAVLTGLREPDSGHISLSGLDRATLGEAGWRQRVTSAPQFHENHIFSASLAFNLLMGRGWPASSVDLQDAEQVCSALGLGELLAKMPSGLHQVVGETGWQLSHGERSRLFLARALLQETDVLILDESFGALDPLNLRNCMATVLARARTVIVIAHP